MSSLEEPYQGLVLLRIELPQRAASALARKNPVNQHHLDYISKAGVLLEEASGAAL